MKSIAIFVQKYKIGNKLAPGNLLLATMRKPVCAMCPFQQYKDAVLPVWGKETCMFLELPLRYGIFIYGNQETGSRCRPLGPKDIMYIS